jgi:hypothetical protein
MNRPTLFAGALFVLVTAVATLSLRAQDDDADGAIDRAIDGAIDWRTDLAAATAEAAKTGRPMLVVFR